MNSSTCPTQSLFFEKFSRGLMSRMGRDTRSNAGLSHLLLIKILDNCEQELDDSSVDLSRKRFILLCCLSQEVFFTMTRVGLLLRYFLRAPDFKDISGCLRGCTFAASTFCTTYNALCLKYIFFHELTFCTYLETLHNLFYMKF